MEIFEVKIINPKATKLLKGLEDLKLISIKDAGSDDSATPKRKKLKQINSAITPQDIYPFKPQYLAFNGVSYIFREKLETNVSYDDGHYVISNELLEIAVWGVTRDEAEEAFAFAFHSLYENFAKESDKNLTPRSRRLKRALRSFLSNNVNFKTSAEFGEEGKFN